VRVFYTVLLYTFMPLILLRMWWRGRKAPAYRQRWAERFGIAPALPETIPSSIWLHAVSVGEVQAVLPLLRQLIQRYPQQILVTTTTPTGSQHLRKALGDAVHHVYLPYDVPFAMQQFLRRQRPRLLLLVETELWPNLLHLCHQRGIQSVLINARMSARSARGYLRFARFTRQTLQYLACVAAQTEADAARFRQLGAPRVQVTGNIKFDIELPAQFAERADALRQLLGTERVCWIAASTHEGEEQILLQVQQQLRQQFPNLLLILVPRHPERFDTVAQLVTQLGLNLLRRSVQQPCRNEIDVYLADTMGELQYLYAGAEIAFVGGSLIERGGHNPLEPALVGLPVLSGVHVFNFADIYQQLVQTQGAVLVSDKDALKQQLTEWLADAALRKKWGQNARQYLLANAGALTNTLKIVEELLLIGLNTD